MREVSTPEDDRALSVVALGNDADALATLLDEYRWAREAERDAAADAGGEDGGGAAVREREREARRYLRVRMLPDGSAELVARLPAVAELLVVAVVDHAVLGPAIAQVAAAGPASTAPLPLPIRCATVGILDGSIGEAKARELACAGSLMTMIMKGGEPVAMGRKVRLHTRAQRRASATRDGHRCCFPGCTATARLEPHHVWENGRTATEVPVRAAACRDRCL